MLGSVQESGPEDLGLVRWELTLCLLAVWCLVFFTLVRGVRSLGKVACLTSTLAVIVMITLMINGIMVTGAHRVMMASWSPNWEAPTG